MFLFFVSIHVICVVAIIVIVIVVAVTISIMVDVITFLAAVTNFLLLGLLLLV